MQIISLLAGSNKSYDHQLSSLAKALLASSCVIRGVGGSLAVTSGQVDTGSAFIQCSRTNGQKVMVLYENTQVVTLTTTGTKKVWIAVDQSKLDDGSTNALDGSGIASIQTGASYPSSNYVPLASITGGVITNAREFFDENSVLGVNIFGISSTGTDAYEITPTPGIYSLKVGKTYSFLADVDNVGACTLKVNLVVGSVTVPLKKRGADLDDGDIPAGGIFVGKYDGTNLQMVSQPLPLELPDLSGYTVRTKSMTISGGVVPGDSVYLTGNNTVKTLLPNAIGPEANVTTLPTTQKHTKSIPLSTNGKYLHISGGQPQANNEPLMAQVRTINAGETDFSNGTNTTIFASNNVFGYDVCEIGTDKFLVIFQAYTASAQGVRCCVLTVSGDTITVGTVVTIETAGNVDALPSCAKADTDKAVIFYNKDSDSDLYGQVLNISGTTITTNTPVSIKADTGGTRTWAVQLEANSICLFYNLYSAVTVMYGRKIAVSSNTITADTENTIHTVGSASAQRMGVRRISSTKVLCVNNDSNNIIKNTVFHVNISGSTLTKSSTIALSVVNNDIYFGMSVISEKLALILSYTTATTHTLYLIDTSGTAPVHVANEVITHASGTDYGANSVVKVAPWTYVVENISYSQILKLIVPATILRIGLAESTIADAGTGPITLRYQTAILSSLTPASPYYVDDNGQPTLKSSLTAPLLGGSISTTQLLLQ